MQYQDRIKKEKMRIIQLNRYQGILISLFAALNITWLLFEIFDYFFINGVYEGSKIACILLILITILLTLIGFLIEKIKEQSSIKSAHEAVYSDRELVAVYGKLIDSCINKLDDNDLLQSIQDEYDKKNWKNVLKIGFITGNLYWTIMRHNLRIKNGEIMLDAIKNMPKRNSKKIKLRMAKIKIDDIGYTKADFDIQKNAAEARKIINEGLSIAKEYHDYYLVSKAYRHLSGTYLKEIRLMEPNDEHWGKKMESCTKCYEKALENSKKIQNSGEKKRMNAYLVYIHGNILLEEGNYLDAENELKRAKKLFEDIDDYTSSVKIYYWLGKIYEMQNKRNKEKAINTYREGYDLAEKLNQKIQSLKNGVALCNLLANQSNEDYLKIRARVEELAKELKWESMLKKLVITDQNNYDNTDAPNNT